MATWRHAQPADGGDLAHSIAWSVGASVRIGGTPRNAWRRLVDLVGKADAQRLVEHHLDGVHHPAVDVAAVFAALDS